MVRRVSSKQSTTSSTPNLSPWVSCTASLTPSATSGRTASWPSHSDRWRQTQHPTGREGHGGEQGASTPACIQVLDTRLDGHWWMAETSSECLVRWRIVLQTVYLAVWTCLSAEAPTLQMVREKFVKWTLFMFTPQCHKYAHGTSQIHRLRNFPILVTEALSSMSASPLLTTKLHMQAQCSYLFILFAAITSNAQLNRSMKYILLAIPGLFHA